MKRMTPVAMMLVALFIGGCVLPSTIRETTGATGIRVFAMPWKDGLSMILLQNSSEDTLSLSGFEVWKEPKVPNKNLPDEEGPLDVGGCAQDWSNIRYSKPGTCVILGDVEIDTARIEVITLKRLGGKGFTLHLEHVERIGLAK